MPTVALYEEAKASMVALVASLSGDALARPAPYHRQSPEAPAEAHRVIGWGNTPDATRGPVLPAYGWPRPDRAHPASEEQVMLHDSLDAQPSGPLRTYLRRQIFVAELGCMPAAARPWP